MDYSIRYSLEGEFRHHSCPPTTEPKTRPLPSDSESEEVQLKPPTPPNAKSLFRVWAWEASSLLLSLSSFICIIVVLAHFDQKGLPNWPLSITLNSFLAFFTTLAKAAFMLPVSAAISQTQWSWFLQPRPLYDFQVLDQASRGAWGSMTLLSRWRIQWGPTIALGALLMIVSAVTSPVTQLAIKYPIRNKEVPRGAYTRAIRQIESPLDSPAHGASTAIVLGIATDKTNYESPIPPLAAFCSTGNCTFDRYHTLGVCMEIANVSSQLKIGQFDDLNSTRVPLIDQFENQLSYRPPGYKLWKASLPGGYDLVHHSAGALILDMLVGNETFGFHDQADLLQTRISSMVLIYSSPIYRDISKGILTPEGIFRMTKEVRHEALEVLFHLCVQTNETQVQGGVERTRMVGSLAKLVEVAEDGPFSLEMNCTGPVFDPERTCVPRQDQWNKTLVLESLSGDSREQVGNFSANYEAMEEIAEALKATAVGYVMSWYSPPGFSDARSLILGYEFATALWRSALFYPRHILDDAVRNESVKNIFLNFATSLSSILREESQWNLTHYGYNITGTAWENESYVQIRWGWLSFLCIELVLATTVLVFTIVTQSSSDEVDCSRDLKDSSLATMVALDSDCSNLVGDGLRPVSELEEMAKGVRARVKGNQLVPVDRVDPRSYK